MANLQHVPGLAGYLAQQQGAQQQESAQLQQAGQVIGLQQALRKQAEAEGLKKALAESGGDVEKALAAAIQSGNLSGAAQLAPIVEARRKGTQGQAIGAGGLRMPDGTIVPPADRPKEFAPPEIERLQQYLGTLPVGDPRRSPVEKRIAMLGERPSGVNVYNAGLTAGVDNQGNPIFVQASGRPGVDPRVVPGVRPPPKTGDEGGLTPENAGKVAMANQAISGVDTVSGLLFDKQGNLNKGLVLAMSVPGTSGLPGNTNARIARSAIRNAVEAKLRMETGAAATESEIDRTLDRFMPTVGDTKESATFKLKELQDFFKDTLSQVKGMKTTTPKRIKFDAQGNLVQ